MQARLESTETQLAEKLQNLQRVQQAAIEYTISSSPNSPTCSPSISRSEVRESPHTTRPGVKKRYETKVKEAPAFPDVESSVGSTLPCDRTNSTGVEDVSNLSGGEPDKNVIGINIRNGSDRNAKQSNVGKVCEKVASEISERTCINPEIDTLKPDGTRD